jgi:hypothetical protein
MSCGAPPRAQEDFASGELDEDCVENGDETHFCINLDNGRTLGFIGDENVKLRTWCPAELV